jgi:hypothetical protein
MYKIWSSYPPAVYQMPLGVPRIAAGTVYKVMWGDTIVDYTEGFPEGTEPQHFEWIRPDPPVASGPLTAEFAYGSKGDIYIVETWADKRPTCTCAGFSFRKQCKHTNGV